MSRRRRSKIAREAADLLSLETPATLPDRTWEKVARGPVTWTWETAADGGRVLKVYASQIGEKRYWGWQVLTFQGYMLMAGSAQGPDHAKALAEAALSRV